MFFFCQCNVFQVFRPKFHGPNVDVFRFDSLIASENDNEAMQKLEILVAYVSEAFEESRTLYEKTEHVHDGRASNWIMCEERSADATVLLYTSWVSVKYVAVMNAVDFIVG